MRPAPLASILALALVLATLPIAIAYGEKPLYAAWGNQTFCKQKMLEAKVIGVIDPGKAVQIMLHGEAQFPVAYCWAPASISVGNIRVALEFRGNLPLFPTQINAYLVVYENGKKVYEKQIGSITFGQSMHPEAIVILKYSCDGRSLEVEAKAGDASYTTTVYVSGGSLAITANAGGLDSSVPPKCKSYVIIKKVANLDCKSGRVDWGGVKPGEVVGDKPTGGIDVDRLVKNAIVAMVGAAALFAIPLMIAAVRKR